MGCSGTLKYMRLPKHIVWSVREIDMNDPAAKQWLIKQVLTNGRMEDILSLDFDEVENLLPHLYLPPPIKKLWSDYFAKKRDSHSSTEAVS